ncbi:hypothetical protein OGAPHI_000273 [Ogataea philodendri]|uniref:Uncharacterized protein n=1 Tax=Ogataea philodendri TaxID=1378263 RepID=A0A9P8TAQ0_9ASCO|nr:uncharacterized protein OGAPHI_000273 [Ogataea philodendri]KAH3671570.1 hypothetical protein OGAPHI_000273 [Ogataea philodendri]
MLGSSDFFSTSTGPEGSADAEAESAGSTDSDGSEGSADLANSAAFSDPKGSVGSSDSNFCFLLVSSVSCSASRLIPFSFTSVSDVVLSAPKTAGGSETAGNCWETCNCAGGGPAL